MEVVRPSIAFQFVCVFVCVSSGHGIKYLIVGSGSKTLKVLDVPWMAIYRMLIHSLSKSLTFTVH